MSIFKFTDQKDNSKVYKYRCLVYPNITYQKDFYKDSYYIIMSNILKHLTDLRKDIHFTILTPEIMPGFTFENSEQVIYKQPSYPNTMRCHFDTDRLKEIIHDRTHDIILDRRQDRILDRIQDGIQDRIQDRMQDRAQDKILTKLITF